MFFLHVLRKSIPQRDTEKTPRYTEKEFFLHVLGKKHNTEGHGEVAEIHRERILKFLFQPLCNSVFSPWISVNAFLSKNLKELQRHDEDCNGKGHADDLFSPLDGGVRCPPSSHGAPGAKDEPQQPVDIAGEGIDGEGRNHVDHDDRDLVHIHIYEV